MNIARTGILHALYRCPGHRLPMEELPAGELIENSGLRDDRHARADSSRQVLLMDRETLELLNLRPGEIKENMTTGGIQLGELSPGRRLAVGSEAVLEITKPCAPCGRMDEIRPGLLKEIAGQRGMLARVVRGGPVRPGDPITILDR